MRFWKFWYRLAFRFCIRLGLLIPRNAGLCDMVKFWEDRKKCEKITNFIWCCLLSSNLGDFFKFMKPSQSIWTLRTNCPLGLKKHYADPMGRASTSKLLTLRAANIPPAQHCQNMMPIKKVLAFGRFICLKAVIALIFFLQQCFFALWLQRCRWDFKSWWARSNVVGIICPPWL